MNNKKIILSKSAVQKKKGVVILPLEKWEKIKKRDMELQMAIEAILAGEMELREGKTRTFEDFLKEYAENK